MSQNHQLQIERTSQRDFQSAESNGRVSGIDLRYECTYNVAGMSTVRTPQVTLSSRYAVCSYMH